MAVQAVRLLLLRLDMVEYRIHGLQYCRHFLQTEPVVPLCSYVVVGAVLAVAAEPLLAVVAVVVLPVSRWFSA
jgi:hypothetical protein